jgi:hypothetical protein
MAQAVSRRPLPGFAPGSAQMGFVDKVAPGQVFCEFFGFPLFVIQPWLSVIIYNVGMNNRPVRGRSSETLHEQHEPTISDT